MLRQDNSVRRMDLNLRLQYLGLDTEIYKLTNFRYCIYCKNRISQFELIQEKFNNEIRQVGTCINLVDRKPSVYLEQLENIDLDNPVDSFKAAVVTEPELQEFIKGMYPEVDIVRIVTEPGSKFNVTVEVGSDTTDNVCSEMKKRLLTRDIGTDDIRIKKVRKDESKSDTQEHIPHNEKIESFLKHQEVMMLSLNKKVRCSIYESDYWFDNAEKIYKGEIRREQIPFYRTDQKCCYMNCSMFEGTNIRKALLLYDSVYLEIPIKVRLDRFFKLQDMNQKELIELVSMGKVVLVLTNAENRYDIDMLNTAYKENPMGVIGRRGVNILLAAYLSQMKERYLRFYPGIQDESKQLYQYGIKNNDTVAVTLAKHLAWPILAKADSFRYLNSYGVFLLSNYGVNKLIEEELELSNELEKKDNLSLEFRMNSYSIHLAMALNATYFPFQQKEADSWRWYTDYHVADIMEKYLTFFWYGHKQNSLINKSRIQQASEQIRFFQSDDEISVLRIAENADKYNTPKYFGDLLEKMARLPLEKRNKIIREYNNLLVEASEVQKKTSVLELFMTGLDFVPKGPMLSTLISLSNMIKKRIDDCDKVLRKHEKQDFIKRVNKVVENKNSERTYTAVELDDIYLLDRIHRVARLKIDKG